MATRHRPRQSIILGGEMGPHYGNWKENATAAEINSRDDYGNPVDPAEEVRQYNLAAAQQGQSIEAARRASVAADHEVADQQFQKQQEYHSLANALGVNVAQPKDTWDEKSQRYIRAKSSVPTYDQLKDNYYSQPLGDQAKIYASGHAPFVAPEEGQKLLQGLAKTREESMNANINSIGSQLAKGEITFEPTDRTFYRTITEPDPNNPLASTKKKVPISLLEKQFVQEGMKRGMLPDIDSIQNPVAQPPAPTATTISPSVATAPQSTGASQADVATRLGQQTRGALTQVPGMIDRTATYLNNAASQFPTDVLNVGKMGVNTVTGAMNAVNRFSSAVAGTTPTQIPQFQYERRPDETLTDLQYLNDEQGVPRRNPRAPAIASALATPTPTPSGMEDWNY